MSSSGLPKLLNAAHYLEIQSLGRYRTLGQKHVEIVRKKVLFFIQGSRIIFIGPANKRGNR